MFAHVDAPTFGAFVRSFGVRQLAAAFFPASLLAGISSKSTNPSQQAGWRQSGSPSTEGPHASTPIGIQCVPSLRGRFHTHSEARLYESRRVPGFSPSRISAQIAPVCVMVEGINHVCQGCFSANYMAKA